MRCFSLYRSALLFRLPDALDMYAANFFVRICSERAVERVVSVRAYKRIVAAKPRHYRGVVKIPRRPSELNEVPEFYVVEIDFFPERTVAVLIADYKIVEVFDARPRRGTLACVYVEPAENRREIHDSASRIQTLRRIVRTISAEIIEIEIPRISPQRPLLSIFYRSYAVVILDYHNTLYVKKRSGVRKFDKYTVKKRKLWLLNTACRPKSAHKTHTGGYTKEKQIGG